MESVINLSFIIVTFNSDKLIVGCIDSIYQYADIAEEFFEIIIVDNSNIEYHYRLTSVLKSYLKKNIKIIHNPKNGGYGEGNNLGIKHSKGKVIAIMNPDVRITEPMCIDVLEKFTGQKLALLGYKQIGGQNISFYIKPEFRNVFYGFFEKFFNKVDVFFPKCFYLSGAFFFLDKQKFEEVGNFDENIFMYYEEPDIANRLQKKGYEIQYDKTKKYHHLVGNRTGFSEIAFEREIRSLVFYLDKFKINKKKYFKTHLTSLKIKIALAKILKDKTREESFKKEIEWLKKLQKDSTLI